MPNMQVIFHPQCQQRNARAKPAASVFVFCFLAPAVLPALDEVAFAGAGWKGDDVIKIDSVCEGILSEVLIL